MPFVRPMWFGGGWWGVEDNVLIYDFPSEIRFVCKMWLMICQSIDHHLPPHKLPLDYILSKKQLPSPKACGFGINEFASEIFQTPICDTTKHRRALLATMWLKLPEEIKREFIDGFHGDIRAILHQLGVPEKWIHHVIKTGITSDYIDSISGKHQHTKEAIQKEQWILRKEKVILFL